MNKQQAISLKLAQWLGRAEAIKARNDIRYAMTFAAGEFNPFFSTTEGRAQFAECVIEAAIEDIEIITGVFPEADHVVNCMLTRIYYAIGGTDTWSGHKDGGKP